MKGRTKALALFSLLLAFVTLGLLSRRVDVYLTKCDCECSSNNQLKLLNIAPLSTSTAHNSQYLMLTNSQMFERRYLSYQPPGNGWNNQRIVLENALVLAKLLNRTLVVHPLSPHQLGNNLKQKHHTGHGYVAYNMLEQQDLLPLSSFMDLELMSELIPVIEVKTPHLQFMSDYSHLTWKNVCHSAGWGYWMDRVPEHTEDVALFTKQKFSSLGETWRNRCPEEKVRGQKSNADVIVRFVKDLEEDPSEMLYFEKGTLFGIHIRFSTYEGALEAQNWVVNYVRYNKEVWSRVERVAAHLGGFSQYNAIQVRRGDHMDRKLAPSFWIEQMTDRNFSKSVPIYVATNTDDLNWFQPFFEASYKLYFATNFTELNFREMRDSLQLDFLGLHEQCICEKANQFIASPASTFDAFILRHRGEVKTQEGLMMDTLHTYWIGHMLAKGD